MIIIIAAYAAYITVAIFGNVKIALIGAACLTFFSFSHVILKLIYPSGYTNDQVLGDTSVDSTATLLVKGSFAALNFVATWGILIALIAGGISIFN
jgi:hypothetical protein